MIAGVCFGILSVREYIKRPVFLLKLCKLKFILTQNKNCVRIYSE